MNLNYIKGIDGLRALAVMAVMFFHIDALLLPGGFTGVDVFFVISGYVVSGSLARESTPKFLNYILGFYARRILRIFPALIVCLLVFSLVVTFFVPSSWLSESTEKTALYAFFGLSNYALIWFTDGYFSPIVEFNSFTHTWSLAVEEQFYVIFPLIFFIWLKYKDRQNILSFISKWILVSLFFLSLLYSWYQTSNNPDSAFYLLPSRFWELSSGALLFMFHNRQKLIPSSKLIAQLVLSLGVIFIAFGFVFSNEKSFPFPWAFFPVIGTVLLISGMVNKTRKRLLLQRIFENSLIVYIGKISYSLYLWHWPVYVLFRWTVGLESMPTIISAFTLTIIFANISYHYIELPVRKNKFVFNKPNWQIIFSGVVIIVISFMVSQNIFKSQKIISLSVTSNKSVWYPHEWSEKNIRKNLEVFAERKLFVLGDSHTSAYKTMLQKLTDEYGVKIYKYASCGYANLLKPVSVRCKKQLDKLIPQIQKLSSPGDIVFFASLRMIRFSDQWKTFSDEIVNAKQFGLKSVKNQKLALHEAEELIQIFENLSMTIMFDAPKPVFKSPPFRCSDWFNKANPVCLSGFKFERELLLQHRKPAMNSLDSLAKKFPKLIIWDPFPILCKSDVCSAFTHGLPLFFDGDHLSAHGNRVLYPSFLLQIKEIWAPNIEL